MFIGHYAVGLAAKRVAPRTSLGTLFAAAQLLDLLWPVLVLLGVEKVRVEPGNTAFMPIDFESYPWTHSLLMSLVWAAVFGLIYRMRSGSSRGAWVLGGLVVSHWILDFATHRPDLPLAPGAVKVGLGLWNSVPATIIMEGGLFFVGLYLYATGTRARNRTGRFAFWALAIILAGIYLASLGTTPPSARAVAVAGLLTWLFIPWGVWIDRNREPVAGPEGPGALSTPAR